MHKLKLISLYDNYGDYSKVLDGVEFERIYDKDSEVYAITDDFVCREEYRSIPKDKKIALLIEPRSFLPKGYEYLEKHYDEYKYVFTFDDKLLATLPNAKPIVFGGVWHTSDVPKTKGISMICSYKNACEGHRKRKEIASILDKSDKVDVMGTWDGGEYVSPKEAFEEYKFNIAMENDKQGLFFTEKLCNCFANKVVPIYYGAYRINEFFDMQGVIYVENRDEIPKIVENLDVDAEYEKRKEAIEHNFELVKKFRSFDDWFYKTYEKEIEEMF